MCRGLMFLHFFFVHLVVELIYVAFEFHEEVLLFACVTYVPASAPKVYLL